MRVRVTRANGEKVTGYITEPVAFLRHIGNFFEVYRETPLVGRSVSMNSKDFYAVNIRSLRKTEHITDSYGLYGENQLEVIP